jgi:(S)-2-hydroxy-acid oxidase
MKYLEQCLTRLKVTLPFGFSPAASMKLAHSDGELATSRAAAKYGLCMGLSSYSNYALEDVAAQGAGNPYFMQMCVLRDRAITIQLLERAESMSIHVFVSKLDTCPAFCELD